MLVMIGLNSLIFAGAAYLIGSVSFAIVVSKIFRLADPRTFGSGNPGATNVLRTGNKAAAALTLLGDCVKGVPCSLGIYGRCFFALRAAKALLRRWVFYWD